MAKTNSTLTPKSTPKDVFTHLLMFIALYAAAISAMALFFQFINLWFPQAQTDYYSSILNTIRYSAAFLVVSYPVYLIMHWVTAKDLAQDPARKEIRIRKWLIYLTLFVAALTVMGDIVTLVYNLLGGEFTVRFVLKVLVVLAVSGKIFGFYILELRGGIKHYKLFAWIGSVGVVAILVIGFIFAGSPAHQRALNFDTQRVSDLQNIQSQIISYWQSKAVLPTNLATLTDSISGFKAPTDPESGQAYEYDIMSTTQFQLCANFDLPSQSNQVSPAPAIYPGSMSDNWDHSGGHACFNRTIDPQLYPPISPVK